MRNLVIIGAGGHARVIADMIGLGSKFMLTGCIVNDVRPGENINGIPVLGNDAQLAALAETHNLSAFITAIGANYLRAACTETILETCARLSPASIVHPAATVAADTELGPGSVVMAGAIINAGCAIGAGCIVNSGAILEHDCKLGDYASIGPGAVLGGSCTVGARSAVGIGATLVQGITVGAHSVIGAGATVLKNIGAKQVAYGTPATAVRSRAIDEAYL